jgi:Fic family protein
MSLKDLIKRIDELQAQIQAHGKLDNETLKRINYKFRLDWNYNSNVMEGNSLTKRETRTIMIGNITIEGKPFKDVLEMRGHNDIISTILKIGKGELNLSEARIKEIHKGIMSEDDPEKKKNIGIWKPYNNYLYNYKNERVDFIPYEEVKDKMHELVNWVSSQYEKIKAKDKKALHPVVLAFEFHLRYITIHPFYDGNGRTARIFMNLILIAFGYPPVIIKLEEKQPYYQYLGDIQAYGGSPNIFYEFMCELLIRSQELVLKAIKGEDIEEEDDLYKEITMWTKEVESIPDPLFKSSQIIYDLYQQSLKQLLFVFIEKHNVFATVFKNIGIFMSFDHSFTRVMDDILLNGTSQKVLDKYINEFFNIQDGVIQNQNINEMFIQLNFNLFKKSIEPFHEYSSFRFHFLATKYTINDGNKELLKKSYKENITENEMHLLVDASVKNLFQRIKDKGTDEYRKTSQ